jgi:putative uncharacterized protein (fragment)
MSLKDNFLKEAHIGAHVELMVGSKEMTGEIISLDTSTVKLKLKNSKTPTISLDLIAYYEVSENNESIQNNIALSEITQEKIIEKATQNFFNNIPFDFNSIESHGLIFNTYFWQNDIKHLSITPIIKERLEKLNSSNFLLNQINRLISKLNYCSKVNEFELKFGRIQPIMYEIENLCQEYNEDFLYELLAIMLINVSTTYKEFFGRVCTNRVIRLGDAVICYNKNRYEEMAYYCSEFFLNVKLTETNFDNLLFVVPYLLKNGHTKVIVDKQKEIKLLSKEKEIAFATVYNNVKATMTFKLNSNNGKISSSDTKKYNQENKIISKVILEEFRAKIKKLIYDEKFSQAYNLVEKKFKEDPENKEISELLQYIGRVKSNYNKFKNLPSDHSHYAKALREWHIYENINSAKKNFLLSIDKKENRFFSAIMDYVEFIMHSDGEKTAVETLISYKDSIHTLDSDSRIKYFEKLYSLYLKGKNYDNLLQCLNSLKILYSNKLKKINSNKNTTNKFKSKVGGTIFRIAQCQYAQGKYQQSIITAKEAITYEYNLRSCVNQIVSSYLSLNSYEAARESVREYLSQDYNLIALFEKIDSLEEAYNTNGTTELAKNSLLNVYDLLGFDNEFVNYYEKNCNYEGISEERKILKNFSEDDLNKIEKEIKFASKSKPKDRADYYLTAACIERAISDKSEKYYGFISNSMLYQGHLLLANKEFDSAKSFYLTAISMSLMSSTSNVLRIEEDAICGYLYCSLKKSKTQMVGENIKFDNEIMILIPSIIELISKEEEIMKDIIKLLHISRLLKIFFDKNKAQSICTHLLDIIKKYLNHENVDEKLWVKIGERYKESENIFKKWYSEVQLNKNFENDIDSEAYEVSKGLLVTSLDIKYINNYLTCCKDIREYIEYTDFDNKIKILNQGMNEINSLISIGHKNATLFFENYLSKVIDTTINNLKNIISKTSEDYKPELCIDVPVTSIPIDRGHVSLSVTISNLENKATARNLSLSVRDLEEKELYRKNVTNNNLKGGSSTSELIKIPTVGNDAFTVNIILHYIDDENESYSLEKQISISTNTEDFKIIKNPYITGKPVENDEMFFGRDILVEKLSNSLNDDRIRCVIIYGQKRTGKSSVFNHLKKRLIKRFIVLNFSVGSDITSENNFYKSVQNEFIDYLEDNNYEDSIIEYFETFKFSDFIDFEKFINKINRFAIDKEKKELLLMIDEFTHIYTYIKNPNYDINENFMDKWKAMIEKNLFKSALIGQDFMLDFIQEYANQFQVTNPIYVSYLERKDAIDLVTKPIAFSNGESRFLEKSEEMIVDWFNGQPFYLQSYCNELVDYINENQKQNFVTIAIAKKVKDVFLSKKELDFFDNLVRKDETIFFNVLLKIAQSSDSLGEKVKLKRLNLSKEEEQALEKLETRGVINYIKSEQKCSIKIPFFHEWLRCH